MRRLVALVAAVVLASSLASSSIASSPPMPSTGFVGDFEVLADGVEVGRITAVLLSVPDQDKIAGTYRFRAADGGTGSGQVGETAFYRTPTQKEVWFKSFEIWYPGTLYRVFVGHFVDVLEPGATDYVEFWGQNLTYDPTPGGTLGSQYYVRFDVGQGTFTLRVPGH